MSKLSAHLNLSETERLLILEGESQGVKEDLAQLIGRFDQFTKQINEWRQVQGKPNWMFILTAAGILIAACGLGFTVLVSSLSVFWFLISSQMSNTINPIKSDVAAITEQVKITSANMNTMVLPRMSEIISQNSTSMQDRRDLSARLDRQQDVIGTTVNRSIANSEGLKEVETQFRANDQLRNVQFSDQQRNNAVVWGSLNLMKSPLPPYPSGPFFQPSISRDTKPPDGNHN